MDLQPDAIDLIFACPRKWWLLEELDNGMILKNSLYNNPNMRPLSVNRHIGEMKESQLIIERGDGFLEITSKGEKIVQQLQDMKKKYRKENIQLVS